MSWDNRLMQGFERMDREFTDAELLAGHLVPAGSMFAFLAAHRAEVFPDADYADLFAAFGRPPLPATRMAAVLALQALHDFSDRETAEAVPFDVRSKLDGAPACGGGGRTVAPGEDVEPAEGSDGTDGRWRIARKVAEDRVISTVDPDARHPRKSPEARRDGYRAHVAADPETGIITDEKLTRAAGQENSDPAVAEEFLAADAAGDGAAAAPGASGASGGTRSANGRRGPPGLVRGTSLRPRELPRTLHKDRGQA